MFLINIKKNKGRAHYWDGVDTFCKMYSTGGLIKKKNQEYNTTEGRNICLMCQNVDQEQNSRHNVGIHTSRGQNG